ncbi:winged helix-turn-helix domain-containing protein [Umezawaea endophytica]|uniref:Response regulator transcription factor n=1 Tax=Umezawaea endophytica TaxID=1654476 RepID=A0A9X3ALK8_9PSEU|nr:response regulator transcription factor [Umezawaea endophytica]MCS7484590.1 response regulator transcription factor [Umezawaea endophytica]
MGESALTAAWESDNSQFHVRRLACVSAGSRLQARLAVLLVDDDTDVVHDLVDALAGQPVELRVCSDPAEALLVLGRTCPDVVLLGPAVGRLDPVDFLSIVRADDPDVPVIVGTGPGSGDFGARATDAGATVIVRRPYRAKELLALLQALAPEPQQLDIRPTVIDLGRLRVDGTVPRMWLDDVEVALPPMEFMLLRYLAERVGSVLTRKDLIAALWGDRPTASNSLTVHVMRLRKRFGDDEHDPQWIRVVRGLGYRFTVPVGTPGSPGVHPH